MNYQICKGCYRKIHEYGLCEECKEKYDLVGSKTKTIVLRNHDYAHKDVSIDVDGQKGFFELDELNEDEIKYLIDRGYLISAHRDLKSKRQLTYLLYPRYNESLDHFFLVKAIEKYVRKYTTKVYLYQTLHPDIIFIAKNKIIAIEIETGKINNNKILENKVNINNKLYGKYWFFVVTSKYYKNKYKKYKSTYNRFEVPKVIRKYFKNNERRSKQSYAPEKKAKMTSDFKLIFKHRRRIYSGNTP